MKYLYRYQIELSLKAIGLYSILLELPIIKPVSESFFIEECDVDFEELDEALEELIDKGYVVCINDLYTINYEKFVESVYYRDNECSDVFLDRRINECLNFIFRERKRTLRGFGNSLRNARNTMFVIFQRYIR